MPGLGGGGGYGRSTGASLAPVGGVRAQRGGASTGGVAGGGGGTSCKPGMHREGVGGSSRCVPDAPAAVGGGAGRAGGVMGGPVARPTPVPINPQAEKDPTLEAYRQQYMGHLGNLEKGAGYSMDVLVGAQKDNIDAQIEQMRQQAAAQGIPFDEQQARSELNRGVNAAMAQEKLGREQMITQGYQGGLGIASTPANERNQRLGIDLQRDIAENDVNAKLYGLDINKYGIDVNAATQANQMLMDFYARLMSGLGNFSVHNESYIG